MKKIRYVIILLLCLFTLDLRLVDAAAHRITLKDLGDQNDLVLSGPQSALRRVFPLPRAQFLANNMLAVELVPAPYLNPMSVFKIYLDGQVVKTVTAGDLRKQSLLKIPLAQDFLDQREVVLEVRPSIFATDHISLDDQRGQLFYTVKNSSQLFLNFNLLPPIRPADFFQSLYKGLAIVLPDQASWGELTAGAWAYGMLQKQYPYQAIALVFARDVKQVAGLPQLWLSLDEHLPHSWSAYAGQSALIGADKLLLSSSSEENLKDQVKQLEPILQRTHDSSNPVKDRAVFFGNNGPQEGLTTVPIDFSLYPALLGEPPKRMNLHLEGQYTPESQSGKAVRMDVYFNRNLIDSVMLDNSGTFKRDIGVPTTLPFYARNDLSLQFQYNDGNQSNFSGPVHRVQIDYSSFVKGSGNYSKERYGWRNFGMLLNQAGAILLPEDEAGQWEQSAANMVLLLNEQLPDGHFAFPELRPLSQYKETESLGYTIVLAKAESLSTELAAYQGDFNSDALGRIELVGTRLVMIWSTHQSPEFIATALQKLRAALAAGQAEGNQALYSQHNPLMFADNRDAASLRDLRLTDHSWWNAVLELIELPLETMNKVWITYKKFWIVLILILFIVGWITLNKMIQKAQEKVRYQSKHGPKD